MGKNVFCILNHPVNIENHLVTCPLISEVNRVVNRVENKLPCKHLESSGDMSTDLRDIHGGSIGIIEIAIDRYIKSVKINT